MTTILPLKGGKFFSSVGQARHHFSSTGWRNGLARGRGTATALVLSESVLGAWCQTKLTVRVNRWRVSHPSVDVHFHNTKPLLIRQASSRCQGRRRRRGSGARKGSSLYGSPCDLSTQATRRPVPARNIPWRPASRYTCSRKRVRPLSDAVRDQDTR